jgi:MFS family permease
MLMIIGNVTGIVVALPTIKTELNLSDTAFVWIIDAYLVTYAGFQLLSGRLGDRLGHRRLLSWGLLTFTAASLGCALSHSWISLVAARALQGLGGAVVVTATLSLIMSMFVEPQQRAKALGVYVFACSGGGVLGIALSAVLTGLLTWRWIFLVNLPAGAAAYILTRKWLPPDRTHHSKCPIDVAGATAMTTSLLIAAYAIVNSNQVGWLSVRTLALLLAAAIVLSIFLAIERRAADPMIPLDVFRNRNLVLCCAISALYFGAASATVLISLYLQRVLGAGPLRVGLIYLPSNILTATFALGVSAKWIIRDGINRPLGLGLLSCSAGILLFARAPLTGHIAIDVLPGLILLGIGTGVAYNPILVAAMSTLPPSRAGIVSGVISASTGFGQALGLAILASVSAARTEQLLASGTQFPRALNSGYHIAFLVAAAAAGSAATLAVVALRPETRPPVRCRHPVIIRR